MHFTRDLHQRGGPFCAVCFGEFFEENLDFLAIGGALGNKVETLCSCQPLQVVYRGIVSRCSIDRGIDVYLSILDLGGCVSDVKIGRHLACSEKSLGKIGWKLVCVWGDRLRGFYKQPAKRFISQSSHCTFLQMTM